MRATRASSANAACGIGQTPDSPGLTPASFATLPSTLSAGATSVRDGTRSTTGRTPAHPLKPSAARTMAGSSMARHARYTGTSTSTSTSIDSSAAASRRAAPCCSIGSAQLQVIGAEPDIWRLDHELLRARHDFAGDPGAHALLARDLDAALCILRRDEQRKTGAHVEGAVGLAV